MSAKSHHLYFLLQTAAHNLKKISDRTLIDTAGITTAQAAVLAIVNAGDGVCQRAVATTLKQNQSAVTAMIVRMLDAGLVTRSPSKNDARAWVVRATSKGRRALSRADDAYRTVNAQLDAIAPGPTADVLARQLQAIAAIDDVS